jgi:hypothetical protein
MADLAKQIQLIVVTFQLPAFNTETSGSYPHLEENLDSTHLSGEAGVEDKPTPESQAAKAGLGLELRLRLSRSNFSRAFLT